jgi:prophage DNA circulation protein
MRLEAGMTIRDTIEQNVVVWLLATLLTGFLSGIGTYQAVLKIAGIETIGEAAKSNCVKSSDALDTARRDLADTKANLATANVTVESLKGQISVLQLRRPQEQSKAESKTVFVPVVTPQPEKTSQAESISSRPDIVRQLEDRLKEDLARLDRLATEGQALIATQNDTVGAATNDFIVRSNEWIYNVQQVCAAIDEKVKIDPRYRLTARLATFLKSPQNLQAKTRTAPMQYVLSFIRTVPYEVPRYELNLPATALSK